MTMLSTTYPLSRAESLQHAVTDAGPHSWGFWATLGWFAIAAATYAAANVLCGLGYTLWSVLADPGAAISFDAPVLNNFANAVSMPAAALVLVLAARRGGISAFNYLGLVMPERRHIVVGLAVMAAYWLATMVTFKLFPGYDQSQEMIGEYRAILGNPTALVLFWLGVVVTVPIAEEVIFRGFLTRGWSQSRLGMALTIPVVAALFAVCHVQYHAPTMLMVFGFGLLLGVIRWRSGSTTLTIMLHAAWNLAVGIYFALQV
jgi:membrane protease YdiL (CAAX protease family)